MHADPREAASASRLYARALFCAVALAALGTPVGRAAGQTDYYNTDRGRPVQIEDAYATERNAFELKLAPATLEWTDGAPSWGIEPELAYGLLPRTHLEVGVPIEFENAGVGEHRSGMAGLEISVMHNLNTETRTLPALGVRADVLAPVGPLAPSRTYATFTGMLTRTYRPLRIHLNGQITAGAEPKLLASPSSVSGPPDDDGALNTAGLSRWLAGAAVDKTFPLHSVLITAELYARQPIVASVDMVELFAGGGMRLQVSPTLALDVGVGRRLDWKGGPWHFTFGSAYAFGLSAFLGGDSR